MNTLRHLSMLHNSKPNAMPSASLSLVCACPGRMAAQADRQGALLRSCIRAQLMVTQRL
jgi:hypothetical protein